MNPQDNVRHFPGTIEDRISTLALSFPCLARASGVRPWDAMALDAWACEPVSTGERITAQFILSVWNPSTEWRCGRFELHAALRVWDDAHLAPFADWVRAPWYP